MMETVGNASRFILVARAPSRIIDALRSRTTDDTNSSTTKEQLISTFNLICEKENISNNEE